MLADQIHKGVTLHLDPKAWTYDALNPVRTLSQLPAALIHTGSLITLAQELRASGGKALGLRICDLLAQDSSRLRVPEWIAIEPSEMDWSCASGSSAWLSSRLTPIKVRSSTRIEDWLDGRSGAQSSRTVKNLDRVWDHAGEVSGGMHPVVLQEYVEGIGLVVDLAYSRLLGRTIARISTGREQTLANGTRRFTSATNDCEGCHFVIDPLTGEFLTPCAHNSLFTDTAKRLPVREIAQELYTRLCYVGINFGVQLEVIIHPDVPGTWHLVQVRPSPERVRPGSAHVRANPDAFLTTPAVSRSFFCEATASLTDETVMDWLMLAATAGGDHALRERGTFHPSEMLVWHRRGDPDWNAWMLEAAREAGARVQITRGVMLVNTSHDEITLRTNAQENACAIIAMPERDHDALVRALNKKPRVLRAVSDGLVGQLAFL